MRAACTACTTETNASVNLYNPPTYSIIFSISIKGFVIIKEQQYNRISADCQVEILTGRNFKDFFVTARLLDMQPDRWKSKNNQ